MAGRSVLFVLAFGMFSRCWLVAQTADYVFFQSDQFVVLPNESFQLIANSTSSSQVSYSWQLGDGRTAEGQEVAVSYSSPGAYEVQLLAQIGESTTLQKYSRWLFVNDPLASVDSRKSAPFKFINIPLHGAHIEVGSSVCFSGQALDNEGDQVTLYWEFGDGTVSQGESMVEKTYAFPGVYNVILWARDSTGLTETYPTFVQIAVFEGSPPPDGKILAPQANRTAFNQSVHEIRSGELLELQGQISGFNPGELPAGYVAYWLAYGQGDPIRVDGVQPNAVFLEPDFYYLYFHVIDDHGKEDPIVDEVLVVVRDDNRNPEDVTILEPNFDPILKPGEGLDLSATAMDLDGDSLTYRWSINDGRFFTGAQVNNVRFREAGLFQVSVTAMDSHGGEARPSVDRYILVQAGDEGCSEIPSSPMPVAPFQHQISGPPGMRLSFEVSWEVLSDQTVEEVRWDFSHGISATGPNPDPIQFSDPGWHPVRVFLRNSCGNWRADALWSIYVYGDNIPPESEIVAPVPNTRDAGNEPVFAVPIGEAVTLAATYNDPDGHYPLFQVWEVSQYNATLDRLETEVFSIDPQPEPLIFNTPGHKTVNLLVFDNRGEQEVFGSQRTLVVVDPNLKPDSRIVLPDGNITVEPGVPVSFEGYGEDPNGLAVSYDWDFGLAANPQSATNAWVPSVVFSEPSPAGQPYEVRLKVRTLFSEEEVASTVFVTVKQFEDSDFEPNDQLQDAAEVERGVYSQLELADDDLADIYRFSVDAVDRDLVFRIADPTEGLIAVLYRLEGTQWQPFPFDQGGLRSGLVTIQDVPAGVYALSLTRNAVAKRRAVTYGLSISTVQPSQYVPFLVADESLRTALGVVNPNGESIFVQAIGLDELGVQIAEVGFRLGPGARRFGTTQDWFGASYSQNAGSPIRWVRLSSERRLASYVVTESQDKTQLMSSAGVSTLADQIMIPHIADPDQGWYTRAVVVNGQGVSEDLRFQSPQLQLPIANPASGNSQQDFRFRDRISGPVPAWGQFMNQTESASLAGVEVFGRTDSKRQMSAIEMIDVRRNNPNFVYLDNSIYFTHIAADTQNWWTGISLINTGSESASYQIIGYDRLGSEVARLESQILQPGGKLLKTSQAIFGEKAVDWMKVEGDGRLAGFELFGDPDLNRSAGFQAATFVTDALLFPHVVTDFPNWTGIALVNVASQPIDVIFQAYNDRGERLAESQQTLAAFAKILNVAQNLFEPGGMPAGTTYIKVLASQPALCGFQLFGTLTDGGSPGEQLAGLAAIPF